MALSELNPKAEAAFKLKLVSALSDASILSDGMLSISSMYLFEDIHKTLPTKLQDELSKYISEGMPFVYFFFHYFKSKIETIDPSNPVETRKISEVPELPSIEEIADDAISIIKGMPYDYALNVEFNLNSNLFDSDRICLSDDISLVRTQEEPSDGLTFIDNPSTFIRVKIKGYLPDGIESETIRSGIDTIKSISGLMVGLGICSNTISSSGTRSNDSIVDLTRERVLSLSDSGCDLSGELHSISPISNLSQKDFKSKCQLLSRFLGQTSEECQRVMTAGIWLHNSLISKDQLLNFVQLTTCIEIVLGEGSKDGSLSIGALLRNRIAYLLGSSASERTKLMKDFDNIYSIRSRILHEGKRKLRVGDWGHLDNLKTLVTKILAKEVELIGANGKAPV